MEQYYPKRGDYPDHIRWFLEKNPDKPRVEAIQFARSQMGHQIAINHMQIRTAIAHIRELLQGMEDMAVALEKGEGSESIQEGN